MLRSAFQGGSLLAMGRGAAGRSCWLFHLGRGCGSRQQCLDHTGLSTSAGSRTLPGPAVVRSSRLGWPQPPCAGAVPADLCNPSSFTLQSQQLIPNRHTPRSISVSASNNPASTESVSVLFDIITK